MSLCTGVIVYLTVGRRSAGGDGVNGRSDVHDTSTQGHKTRLRCSQHSWHDLILQLCSILVLVSCDHEMLPEILEDEKRPAREKQGMRGSM